MTRSKLSTKALLLAGGIGLSVAAFAASQPAAAQSYADGYACPATLMTRMTMVITDTCPMRLWGLLWRSP